MYRAKAYKNQDRFILHLFSDGIKWEADKLTVLSNLMERYSIPFLHIPVGKVLFEVKNIPLDDIHSILLELERYGFAVSSERQHRGGK
ncbi:MAG: hypothetical protein IBX39_08225 [Candidatus Methanoperedenaceae archaeon]|nr:hypothetical protein [Candidatus Methanoperedenaceae archaeon]